MSNGIPIRCHTAFKHYEALHSGGCCCGDICESIWSRPRTSYHIEINDGGWWGGFSNVLGRYFGSVAAGICDGLFNNLCGWGGNGGGFDCGWGGGWSSFIPIGNRGWDSWNNGGGWNSRWNNNNNNNNSTKNIPGSKDKDNSINTTTRCTDEDQKEITKLDKALNELDTTQDGDKALELYNRINELIKKPVDDAHKNENIENYKLKLERLKNKWDFEQDKDGKIKAKAKTSNIPNKVGPVENKPAPVQTDPTYNETLTEEELAKINEDIKEFGKAAATSEQAANITSVLKANDPLTSPVLRKNDQAFTMSGKYKDNNKDTSFPLYITITTNNHTFNYKCIHVTSSGHAIYATPKTDGNNNKYILTIQNGEFVLDQGKKLRGLEDTQNKNAD